MNQGMARVKDTKIENIYVDNIFLVFDTNVQNFYVSNFTFGVPICFFRISKYEIGTPK